MGEKTQERIGELESRIAFHEEHIQALEHALMDQRNLIDAIRRQLRELSQQVRQIRPAEANAPPEDEIPPHY